MSKTRPYSIGYLVAHSVTYWTPTPATRVRSQRQEVVVSSLVAAEAFKFGQGREESNEECCGVCCVVLCGVFASAKMR